MGEKLLKIEQFPEPVRPSLAKGDRIELIPVKDGVKVMSVHRKEVK